MWQDLFVRYGTEQETSEVKLSLYLRHPRTLSKAIDGQRAHLRAAQEIERLQQLIEDLQKQSPGIVATMDIAKHSWER